jgi:hypothetical protein
MDDLKHKIIFYFMMAMIIVPIILMYCKPLFDLYHYSHDKPTEINIKLVYFKTTKTNLCYGGLINKQNEMISITCVPCSNVDSKLLKSVNEY